MTRGPPASADEQREFAARYASLADTAAFAQAFCARHRIDPGRELKLTLILEELLTNTVEHGFGAEGDSTVRVTLGASVGRLTVLYEDAAPAFDPLAASGVRAPVDQPLEDRPIGGLGIRLVEGLASEARYARVEGRNQLWLALAADADSSLS